MRRSGRGEVNVSQFQRGDRERVGKPSVRLTRINLREGKTKLRRATGQGRAGWQLAAERERACPGRASGCFSRGAARPWKLSLREGKGSIAGG